jgi:hypothetical protein
MKRKTMTSAVRLSPPYDNSSASDIMNQPTTLLSTIYNFSKIERYFATKAPSPS